MAVATFAFCACASLGCRERASEATVTNAWSGARFTTPSPEAMTRSPMRS